MDFIPTNSIRPQTPQDTSSAPETPPTPFSIKMSEELYFYGIFTRGRRLVSVALDEDGDKQGDQNNEYGFHVRLLSIQETWIWRFLIHSAKPPFKK